MNLAAVATLAPANRTAFPLVTTYRGTARTSDGRPPRTSAHRRALRVTRAQIRPVLGDRRPMDVRQTSESFDCPSLARHRLASGLLLKSRMTTTGADLHWTSPRAGRALAFAAAACVVVASCLIPSTPSSTPATFHGRKGRPISADRRGRGLCAKVSGREAGPLSSRGGRRAEPAGDLDFTGEDFGWGTSARSGGQSASRHPDRPAQMGHISFRFPMSPR